MITKLILWLKSKDMKTILLLFFIILFVIFFGMWYFSGNNTKSQNKDLETQNKELEKQNANLLKKNDSLNKIFVLDSLSVAKKDVEIQQLKQTIADYDVKISADKEKVKGQTNQLNDIKTEIDKVEKNKTIKSGDALINSLKQKLNQ